ncbi:NAD(P)H-hydrate dehydratase [Cytophagaceae bacterium 50C-KIRBA]|uniref:ADP-dependent (S)-NAD(P)H-hydrate dehydratase n=1 Tax=Aquirufa beregesia TaxID=2516556 RepID=A0ABX0F0A5_9BACT|nr:NAD(P)H-hydrate dehydratase [Aquirufa beregesia]NGZ45312.1 NAD(P)H-hydrate dehydratase [Aquirufa beregesia]
METVLQEDWVQSHRKERAMDGHKRSFGHVWVIAGSEGKLGASALSSRAALRAGCGLVTAIIPSEGVIPLLANSPEVMYEINGGRSVLENLPLYEDKTAIVYGPGVGLSELATEELHYLMEHIKTPMVIDADGLTLLAQHPEWYALLHENHILTPHLGELSRLVGKTVDAETALEEAQKFVHHYPVQLVVKGKNSHVFTSDGKKWVNSTGNDGMATAGSGDVLSGIIASLAAQSYPTGLAACLGVYYHGLAGDLYASTYSKSSLMAGDLIEMLKEIKI